MYVFIFRKKQHQHYLFHNRHMLINHQEELR